ncbi:hypothetical protein, partial [Aeromonas caviae]|uniref:hypothetical protein n=1 Tax=Aeromonas caviae TaxID=648 RepID=UPI001C57B49B
EGGNINMMHGDSRVMVVVCLETASLPAPCLSTSTSPRSREEPEKRPKSYENATCDPHGTKKWTHTGIVGHGDNHCYDFYTFFSS